MDIDIHSRHVSRLEVVETGRRRRWSEAEKLRIVEESYSEPRFVSATARRYGITNQHLFLWRRMHREGRLGAVAGFVPAVIVPEASPEKRPASASGGQMEVVTGNGRRVVVDRGVDVEALVRVVRALETLR